MNNDELKKKIVETIKDAYITFGDMLFRTQDGGEERRKPLTECIADALIAAGIGDVKEAEAEANRYEMLYKLQNRDMALAERRAHDAEHCAEKAEKALRNMASNYWGVECRCLGAYDWEECEKCKEKYILSEENEAVDCLVKVHLEQAEKELQEERKDE